MKYTPEIEITAETPELEVVKACIHSWEWLKKATESSDSAAELLGLKAHEVGKSWLYGCAFCEYTRLRDTSAPIDSAYTELMCKEYCLGIKYGLFFSTHLGCEKGKSTYRKMEKARAHDKEFGSLVVEFLGELKAVESRLELAEVER